MGKGRAGQTKIRVKCAQCAWAGYRVRRSLRLPCPKCHHNLSVREVVYQPSGRKEAEE